MHNPLGASLASLVVKWTVLGDPVPKGRPRVFRRGNFVQAVTPQRTRDYEARIHASARSETMQGLPLEGPVWAELHFYTATRRRADLDNLVKSTLDGMNGVAFLDDHQVSQIFATRRYDKQNPRVEIALYKGE